MTQTMLWQSTFSSASLRWATGDLERMISPNFRFIAENVASTFDRVAIIDGVIILVIAEVFRVGTRLDEEQSLTV